MNSFGLNGGRDSGGHFRAPRSRVCLRDLAAFVRRVVLLTVRGRRAARSEDSDGGLACLQSPFDGDPGRFYQSRPRPLKQVLPYVARQLPSVR